MHMRHLHPVRLFRTRNSCRFSTVSALAFCLSAPMALAAESGSPSLTAISTRMQQFVDQGQIAGAVTVVGRHNQILDYAAVGLRDIETHQPMTKDTLFRIASMTKPVTAIGIMILAEQGKLSVDDAVERHLPEFRGQMLATHNHGSVVLKPPARKITIRDLLTHTSGVPSGLPPDMADLYVKRDRTLAEVVPTIAKRPLEFEPGSRWAYCNLGIDTLGRIIEVVSGRPYEQFLQQRISLPLAWRTPRSIPTAAAPPNRLALRYPAGQAGFRGLSASRFFRERPLSHSRRWAVFDRRGPGPALSDDALRGAVPGYPYPDGKSGSPDDSYTNG